jgi:hypothetical protein
MSYQIQLSSAATPEVDLDVFPFMNKLRQDAGAQPPSVMLKRFHDALLALFPDAPWTDGHYAGDAGRLTLIRRHKVVVPHVLYLAGELGLTVVDNQTGEVHRPPTYQVMLEGPAEGVGLGDAATRLAALMRKPVSEMLAVLSRGRQTVKKGVPRYQARQYVETLRERAGCHATLAPEPGRVVHPEPPAPPPAPVRPAVAEPAPAKTGLALAPLAEPVAASRVGVQNMPPLSRAVQESTATADSMVDSGADHQLYVLADGIRLTIYATLLYLVAAYFFRSTVGYSRAVLSVGVTVLLMCAVYRLAKGAGSNIVMRIIAVILMIIPLANLLTLVLMIRRGKVILRENEAHTSWLGAAYPEICRLRGGGMPVLPSTLIGVLGVVAMAACLHFGSLAAERQMSAMLGPHPQPCVLVGAWKSSRIGPDGVLLLHDDGTYNVTPYKGREGKLAPEAGRWQVKNHVIEWETPVPGQPHLSTPNFETFKLSPDGMSITIFEGTGFTNLDLASRLPSARCGFN